jgi:hypothetical protein
MQGALSRRVRDNRGRQCAHSAAPSGTEKQFYSALAEGEELGSNILHFIGRRYNSSAWRRFPSLKAPFSVFMTRTHGVLVAMAILAVIPVSCQLFATVYLARLKALGQRPGEVDEIGDLPSLGPCPSD